MRRQQRKADTLALQRELDRIYGERDTARQDVATLTEALAHALNAVGTAECEIDALYVDLDAARRETAAVEERADQLGLYLELEHAAARTLRAALDEYEVRYGRLTVTVPPSGLPDSGEVSPGAAPCGPRPGVNAPADGGTVTL